MARTLSSTKRSLITDANSKIVIATAVAAFLVVFSLIASKTLVSQASYQNRVITAKKKALSQLQSDLNARDSLVSSYKAFGGTSTNVLGGNPNGTGDQDGDNAKIVLDALPSKYDFPALTTSLEKMIIGQKLTVSNITGTDEEITQQAKQSSATPSPITMPFQIAVVGSYQNAQGLVKAFERSIRPFEIQSMDLTGDEGNMAMTIKAQTYYQPEKSLKITTEVVK